MTKRKNPHLKREQQPSVLQRAEAQINAEFAAYRARHPDLTAGEAAERFAELDDRQLELELKGVTHG